MAVVFTIDPRIRLVSVKFEGNVEPKDVVGYLESLKADPLFEPGFSELVDLTEVLTSAIDFEAAMVLAHHVDPFSPTAKRAFVVSQPAIFGAIRMYQMAREDDTNIVILPSIEEARRWLETQRAAKGAS